VFFSAFQVRFDLKGIQAAGILQGKVAPGTNGRGKVCNGLATVFVLWKGEKDNAEIFAQLKKL